MPAAAWAARSGDPVLFAEPRLGARRRRSKALRRHDGRARLRPRPPRVAISAKALKEIEQRGAERRAGRRRGDPVENAIAFARYSGGSFGWNINDPGHGFVLANTERPLDAAAAAPLSASGTWGPLLAHRRRRPAARAPLRDYLLDLKPGYEDDPTRAVYNHVWLIGDPDALSVDLQAQVDELAEVAPVTSGLGDRRRWDPRPGPRNPSPSPNSNPSQSR